MVMNHRNLRSYRTNIDGRVTLFAGQEGWDCNLRPDDTPELDLIEVYGEILFPQDFVPKPEARKFEPGTEIFGQVTNEMIFALCDEFDRDDYRSILPDRIEVWVCEVFEGYFTPCVKWFDVGNSRQVLKQRAVRELDNIIYYLFGAVSSLVGLDVLKPPRMCQLSMTALSHQSGLHENDWALVLGGKPVNLSAANVRIDTLTMYCNNREIMSEILARLGEFSINSEVACYATSWLIDGLNEVMD